MKFESAFKNTTWIRILDFATFSFQHAMSYKKRRESIQNPPSNLSNYSICLNRAIYVMYMYVYVFISKQLRLP